MGTRFLASKEIEMPAEEYRHAILGTKGGGITTARSTVFDELKGKNMWPSGYDGRAIAGASYKDALSGVHIEDLRSRHAVAAKESHKGFGGEGRVAIWAGTGIGFVTEVKAAGEIVKEVRESARLYLEAAIKGLSRVSKLKVAA